jgi:phospholipid N-methyltransferase
MPSATRIFGSTARGDRRYGRHRARRPYWRDVADTLKSFLQDFSGVGEFLPTAWGTCETMARAALATVLNESGTGALLELGGGTGRSTEAMLNVAGSRLVITCEINPRLRAIMKERFRGVSNVVVLADALEVEKYLADNGIEVGAIVSFLPFTSLPSEVSDLLVEMIRRIGGSLALIQYFRFKEQWLVSNLGQFTHRVRYRWNAPPCNIYIWTATK